MSADLDNFFARKDKKKSGKKVKESLKIEVVPNYEDFDDNSDRKTVEYNGNGYSKKDDSDNEWIEEVPIEVDFTSLNIQNLDLNELNALIEKKLEVDKDLNIPNDENDINETIAEGENETSVAKENGNLSGWKISEGKKKTQEKVLTSESVIPEKKLFIPPHLRKEIAKKKAKVFVDNEEEFPSLLK